MADGLGNSVRMITPSAVVSTIAGLAPNTGYVDGTNTAARFNSPSDLTVSSDGNVFVAEYVNCTIRQISTDGVVSTFAGGGVGSVDGSGDVALFNFPSGVAVDNSSNVYVADSLNHVIRQISPAGFVTALAGSPGIPGSTDGTNGTARFNNPLGVAVDNAGNIYVADASNDTIRRITTTGVVTTLAGLAGASGSADGTNTAARFNQPTGVALDNLRNIYVADTFNHTIRLITPAGNVTTIAGLAGSSGSADGTNGGARFNQPNSVTVDSSNNVYVADSFNHTIRSITPAGVVTTIAGLAGSQGSVDGIGTAARFSDPLSVSVDIHGNVYVADTGGTVIRRITSAGQVTTLGGFANQLGSTDGTAGTARFNSAGGVAVDASGNVYVADTKNCSIRKGIPTATIPPPTLRSAGVNGGLFGLNITGLPGLALNIQTSVDLVSWQTIGSCTLTNGTTLFADTNSLQQLQFYRAQLR